jgi:hypothetical protein
MKKFLVIICFFLFNSICFSQLDTTASVIFPSTSNKSPFLDVYNSKTVATDNAKMLNKGSLHFRNLQLLDVSLIYAFHKYCQLEIGNTIFTKIYKKPNFTDH